MSPPERGARQPWHAAWITFAVVAVASLGTARLFAQEAPAARQVFESACAACHGVDGRGTAAIRSNYPLTPPDFTVLVLPGESVRVQVTFTKHRGTYLYHCHILEHEDMGMMRNFQVT